MEKGNLMKRGNGTLGEWSLVAALLAIIVIVLGIILT